MNAKAKIENIIYKCHGRKPVGIYLEFGAWYLRFKQLVLVYKFLHKMHKNNYYGTKLIRNL